MLVLSAGLHLGAQAPAASVFEVASLKPSPPGDPSNPLRMFPVDVLVIDSVEAPAPD